jgi:hypothetical protein
LSLHLPLPRLPLQVRESSAASRSLIAGPRELPEAISSARPVQVVLLDSSQALVRVPNTRRAQDLQAPAGLVLPADVPDSGHAQASALRAPAALADRDLLEALRLPARLPVRSAHRRIALAAVDNSIRRRRKAQ